MKYNRLGQTGLFVSELTLGAMTFGGSGGMWSTIGGLQQDAATSLVKTAFDTANVYSNGISEQMTGQAFRDLGLKRSEYVIATKALGPMGEGVNDRGASRYHLMQQIDESLERLEPGDVVELTDSGLGWTAKIAHVWTVRVSETTEITLRLWHRPGRDRAHQV